MIRHADVIRLMTPLSPVAGGTVDAPFAPEGSVRADPAGQDGIPTATGAPRDRILVQGVDQAVVQIVRNMNALLDSLQRGSATMTAAPACVGSDPSLTLSDILDRLRAYNAQLAGSEIGKGSSVGVSVEA